MPQRTPSEERERQERKERERAQAARDGAPSPRKTKQTTSKSKPPMPNPPRIIVDDQGLEFKRGELLGQGGFARVYQVEAPNGEQMAFKCVLKSTVESSKKNRSKILAEIMIHKSLDHPNIVKFEDTFEDDECIYFKLELCSNGSMNDIVKRRGSYTEGEARFYMVQILAACQKMHSSCIIHRDLKLGNIFLDKDMNVKIGDFGLAALLKDPEERKKTVCGTPNYIAPEVLYDSGSGHSFEVDVWSVGVIIYTLLIGKPPFQTSNVNRIYEKIKRNEYEIPAESQISNHARDLIKQILTPLPSDRPSLIQIMNHSWFKSGHVPLSIPSSATAHDPQLQAPKMSVSLQNLEILKRNSLWNENADDLLEDDDQIMTKDGLRAQEEAEEKREKMDKDITRVLQPGSPISALLKVSRQPLAKTGAPAVARSPNTGLARQLSTLSLSRQQQAAGQINGGGESGSRFDKENAGPRSDRMAPPSMKGAISKMGMEEGGMGAERQLNQKARLVAGMTAAAGSAVSIASNGSGGSKFSNAPETRPIKSGSSTSSQGSGKSAAAIIDYLSAAVNAFSNDQFLELSDHEVEKAGLKYYEEEDDLNQYRQFVESPKHFIVSWLDHSAKYGLGYALSSGGIGVHLKDSTSLILSATRGNVDYISPASSSSRNIVPLIGEERLRRDNFSSSPADDSEANDAAPYPDALAQKVKIVKFFENEIMARLYANDSPLAWVDEDTHSGMVFVHKWFRTEEAIMFRFSDGSAQFNFYDHVKLFISHGGLVISVIDSIDRTDGEQVLRTWALDELLSIAKKDRSRREEMEANLAEEEKREPNIPATKPQERKLARQVLKKLRYARDTLRAQSAAGFHAKSGSQLEATPRSASTDTLSKTASMASINASNTAISTTRHR